MLEAANLECVRGDRRLFRNLSFIVRAGEVCLLTGRNGSGKTSLLRILCGLMPPAAGAVRWQGSPISDLGEDYYRDVAYIGHRSGVTEELTAVENLRTASAIRGIELSRRRALEALEVTGLLRAGDVPARFLSEGQRRRIALARLVVCPAKLWLLDEVFTSLDKAGIDLVVTLLNSHASRGGEAIVATHHDIRIFERSGQTIELAS